MLEIEIITCSSYIALYPRTSSKCFTYYYPRHTCTDQHLRNSTEHTTQIHATRHHVINVQYIAFSVYCQVLILWLSKPEHISGTNLAQGLLGSED